MERLAMEYLKAAPRWFAAACCAVAAACAPTAPAGLPAAPDAARAAEAAVPPATPAIWFHPLPPNGDGPGTGSVDFMSLFRSDAAWPAVARRTSVIGLYAGWAGSASQSDVATVVAFLQAHGMSIELEAPSLQASATCGTGVEGYVPYGQSLHDYTLAYLRRLAALHAPLAFIKVDEPFFFGSVTTDPRSCHFTVSKLATYVGDYVKLVHSVFPTVEVGDVEPAIASAYAPNVVTAMARWHEAYRRATGAPFPFYISDNDFADPSWPALAKQLERQTKAAGMQSGIIYIGDPTDASDAQWSAKVEARFRAYQGPNGGKPDFVLFQSWEPHPRYCLPESEPATFTGTIDDYLRWSARS